MSDFDYKEKRFEQDIEEYLTTYGGYLKGDPAAFDREKALDIGHLPLLHPHQSAQAVGAV